MGKYLKKSKPKAAYVSQRSSSHLLATGVRTRSKTLALRRLRQPQPPPEESESELSYLQFGSRRLHKTNVSSMGKERERKALAEDEEGKGGCCGGERGIDPSDSFGASFGENDPEFDASDRSTRESTPCSFIGGSNTIPMPGSSARRRSSIPYQRTPDDVLRGIPTTQEIEDVFATAEEHQRKSFIEKYNFDILNDTPLAGRYEWLEVKP